MRTLTNLTALAAAAALFAGCASTPTVTPQLQQARAEVRAAEADPAVLKYAPLELKKASDSLKRADELSAKREAPADIDSAAYVAATQARTAKVLAKAQSDEDAIKSAEAERERARADANARRANSAQAQAASAQAAAANASADADAARRQAAAAQAQAAELQRELQARQTERGMLVTLGDVLFEFGRAEIRPAAGEAIGKLAAYLSQYPDRRVLIEGFTDSVGSDAANQVLSQRRAQAVADALRARGVDPARIATRGYGEQYPVASNASTSDRAMNRRVEVYISNDNQPVRARS